MRRADHEKQAARATVARLYVPQLLCLRSILSCLVGVRSPVMAESRWTLPALLEGAGNGPMSYSVSVLACSQCVLHNLFQIATLSSFFINLHLYHCVWLVAWATSGHAFRNASLSQNRFAGLSTFNHRDLDFISS